MENDVLVPTLSAAASYALGDPITVTLTLTNSGADALQVLTWGTPLEGKLTIDCFRVERDGEAMPYDGVLVKRGDPPADAYVLIRPGESANGDVDLATAYPIDQPGHYAATLDANLFDAFSVPGNAKEGPRKRQDHAPRKLAGASVSFEVVAGAEAKETSGATARKASPKQAKSSAKAPSFNGGTNTQQADTVVAHGNAQVFSALAAAQLAAGPASTNGSYKTWFGAFDQGRYDEVTKDFNDISNALISDQVTYDFTGSSPAGDSCAPGDFAFTYKGSRTVWLCSSYLSAAQIGIDCKFGTLVHEWSHAVASTDDNAYGQTACKNLANTDPGKAANNADSHEYFAEEVAVSNFGKSFTFITDRSTFGRDEIDAMLLSASPAVIAKAFYVVADGFWPDKLNITAGSLGNSPNVKPAISVSPAVPGMTITVTSLEAEDTALPIAPQRFTWVCQIAFANDNGFPTAAGGVQTVTLTATLNGLSSSAQIQLIREPNPYELDGSTSWLSTDLRVFQIRAGEARFGATIGSSPAAASAFIKQVIANLNSGNSGGQTFDGISTDQQTSALELAQKVNGTNVYNFAVAKVRYRGTTDISNVRAFFRLFPVSTATTLFDSSTTYRRSTSGGSAIPLLGLSGAGDLLTIPCFAEPRVDSATTSMPNQTDPSNVRTIAHAVGGAEAAAYFGAWLDINQTDPQFPINPSPADGPWSSGRKSVQQLIRNAHQCLVAEIAFDPDPIPAGASPGGSDKLAQRNLAIVDSANPGDVASRRILSTFELRPAHHENAQVNPDELLIEWGSTPRDSIATIFIPEVDAGQIIALAGERYGSHPLTQVDAQTIQVPVGGISYVPLPPGAAFGLTGLVQIDLPPTVKKGQVYTVVVRQVTDAAAIRVPPRPEEVIRKRKSEEATTHGRYDIIRWRRIVGSFQITIPVRTKEVMLARETRLLSVLRWILESVPTDDRWYQVFSRYVGLIGERVGALGGDPDSVFPSPEGDGGKPRDEPAGGAGRGEWRGHHVDGKITGLIYDCFGDFEGFVLDECGNEVVIAAREHRIEALAEVAWRERIFVTVVANAAHPPRPVTIIYRRAPEPFQL